MLLIIGFPRFYGTEIPLALLVFPFYLTRFLRVASSRKKDFLIFFLLLLLWVLTGLISTILRDGTFSDWSFHISLMVKVALSTYFGVVLYIMLARNSKPLLYWLLLQSIFIFISSYNHSFYSFLLKFISPRSADVFKHIFGLRALGFGLFHVDGAFVLTSAAAVYFSLNRVRWKGSPIWILVLPIASVVARSALVVYLLYSLLLKIRWMKFSLLVAFLVMFVGGLTITAGPFYEACENFRLLAQKGTVVSSSISATSSMYAAPRKPVTLLLGDGKYFDNSSETLTFYMSTDVGYLRILYYSGFFSVLLFIAINIYFLIPRRINWQMSKLNSLALGMILSLLILNGKGIQLSTMFASMLYFIQLNYEMEAKLGCL